MVPPLHPVGPVSPGGVGKPALPGSAPGAFAARLAEGLRPADPKLRDIQRLAAQSLGTEVWEARLLETYDMLSSDEALYEVQTPKGTFQVMKSRSGACSVYPA